MAGTFTAGEEGPLKAFLSGICLEVVAWLTLVRPANKSFGIWDGGDPWLRVPVLSSALCEAVLSFTSFQLFA